MGSPFLQACSCSVRGLEGLVGQSVEVGMRLESNGDQTCS